MLVIIRNERDAQTSFRWAWGNLLGLGTMNAFKEGVLFDVPDAPSGTSRNNIITFRTWSVSPNPNGLTAESDADHGDFQYLYLVISHLMRSEFI